ncbi:MAG: hypothetical protein KC931_27050, partial [Candidatus Omnitrophica bacterium]|nr:hypothetical protein [Candidatus Omnitrophota bacterium]
MADVEKKAEEVGSTLRKVNADSKGVTGGVSGMTGAFRAFGGVAKFAAVTATVGIAAVAAGAVVLTRVAGTALVGAFKIATAAVRVLWNAGVAAFRGIASAASTAVGWVTKIGTVVAGSLVGGLLIGIKRSAELQEKWKAMGGIVPVMYQVKGAFASLKDTFINGLAVMADSFLASSGLVGGLYQLRDLIIQNGGLFRQAGTWLGEGFVWAKEKVIGVVGFIRDRLPTIIDVATQVGDAIVRGVSWAYGALVRFGGLVIENLPRIKDAIVATWDFAIEG